MLEPGVQFARHFIAQMQIGLEHPSILPALSPQTALENGIEIELLATTSF
jgi:hypothetical protein